MKSSHFSKTFCVLLAGLVVLCSTALLAAGPPSGKGKPPKDDPPPSNLPEVRYTIHVAPITPGLGSVLVWGMNNLGMAVGKFGDADGSHPFIYDPISGTLPQGFYDLTAEPGLTGQLDALSSGSVFSQLYAVNELTIDGVPNPLGGMVGEIDHPSTNVRRGFVIKTNGSSAVTDWTVELLPDFGGGASRGSDINNAGDVFGAYRRTDGTWDRFLYNPWFDVPGDETGFGLPDSAGSPYAKMNNLLQVAVREGDTILVFDGNVRPPRLCEVIEPGRIADFFSLNDAGMIAAVKRDQTIGGKGKRYDIVVKYDSFAPGQGEEVLRSRPYTLYPGGHQFMNLNEDMALQNDGNDNSGRIELIHRGFSADSYTQRVFNVDDLIDENDPWKADWIAAWGTGLDIQGISNRSDSDDATGYPIIAGTFSTAVGRVCAVLEPLDVTP